MLGLAQAKGKPKLKTIKVLFDSGGSKSVIKPEHYKNLHKKKDSKTQWQTPQGTFTTSEKVKVRLSLP